jgi:hypothetical protein
MIYFIHAHQSGSEFEHVTPQGDNNELCVLSTLLDITRNNRHLKYMLAKPQKYSKRIFSTHIPEIQRGINLVHDIQRRRLIMM